MAHHKFRQSLAQMEHAFIYEQALDQQRREEMLRTTEVRARKRARQRERQRSNVRFYLLTLSLILTAVIVTAVMLGTLYLLLT